MPILNGLKRLTAPFQSYKRSMELFARLKADGLIQFDTEHGDIELDVTNIPDERKKDEAWKAVEVYGKTVLWRSRAAEYTRTACIVLTRYVRTACMVLLVYVGYLVFFG